MGTHAVLCVDKNWSDEQRAAVREEIEHILAHPIFRASDRCSELLGYVVHRILDGEEGGIKERTLGIEVFGRDANYDTGEDPVVRRIASEVRKRLAQYYQEVPDGHAVVIHLKRGGYIPECEFLSAQGQKLSLLQSPPSEDAPRAVQRPKPALTGLGRLRRRRWAFLGAALVLLIAAVLALWRANLFSSPAERVWRPLLDAKGTVILCLPNRKQPPAQANPQARPGLFAAAVSQPDGRQRLLPPPRGGEQVETPGQQPSVFLGDLTVGYSVAALLSRHGKKYAIRTSSALTYPELQNGPVVLVGGVNNHWVRDLLSNLRYSVQFDMRTRESWVQDAQAPSRRNWRLAIDLDGPPPSVDYAVITRVFNQETGQWILALSGLQGYATKAAGEFVTNPKYAEMIPSRLHGAGNFQIVIRTAVMGAEPGPIEVEAIHTW